MSSTATLNTNPTGADLLAEMLQRQIGTPITGDEVEFHDSSKIVLPRGTTFERAFKILKRLQEEAETPTTFERKYLYRADDGAHATFQVIKAKYGMLMGKPQQTFFGLVPAETKTIQTGVGISMQIPVGLIEIPVFPGLQLYVGETRDRDYGDVFCLKAMGPRKFKDDMEDLFDAVEMYLAGNSIYRGHAIIGASDPEFLDLRAFKREQVVFSDEVHRTLEGTLFAPIRHTDAMRREGVPLKRALLLYGPYGTGKTSTGQMTAQTATENGWTFVSARPGIDKVEDVLKTARLYQPAVVFVEDIDGAASSGEADDVTKLLDAFDGITAKGGEIVVLMTTNHLDRIHKGMLRPGRLDAVVHIGSLDRNGIERLIKTVVASGKLAADVDYDAVAEAMDGFFPAFVRESITRAVTFAINRLEGKVDYVIDTPDLVDAAHSLIPQLQALHDAGEGERRPTLSVAFEEAMVKSVKQVALEIPGAPLGRLIDAPAEDSRA